MQICCSMYCHKKYKHPRKYTHTHTIAHNFWHATNMAEVKEAGEAEKEEKKKELVNLNSLCCCVEINACIIYKLTRAGLETSVCVSVRMCVCL